MVRSWLAIYALLASFAVFLLWRNSAAPDGFKNVGILVASILPVLIVTFPYLNQEKIERHSTFVLFYDSKNKSITSGDKPNPYSSSYMHMFTNLTEDALKVENFSELMEAKGFDIIEKGIVEALSLKFSNHWDIEMRKFEGPASTSETISPKSTFRSDPIQLAKIQEIFKHNLLIAKLSVLVFPKIYFPPNGQINVKITENSRTILFNNSYITLEIAFHASSGMVTQQGIWGVLTLDPLDMNRYYIVEYPVDIKLSIKRTRAYSPEVKTYKRWFENVCDTLSQYDWNVVDKKVDKTLSREAISKILGL